MTPERRARQAAIMRERWATRRAEMAAILARATARRVAAGHHGWQAYHAHAGHDGGYSAALADGAHDGPYKVVRTLGYWEALHEPAWDIGWGDLGSARAPAQLPADAVLERHRAHHWLGWHWAGWVIRRPADPPDESVDEVAAAQRQARADRVAIFRIRDRLTAAMAAEARRVTWVEV